MSLSLSLSFSRTANQVEYLYVGLGEFNGSIDILCAEIQEDIFNA